MEVKKMNELGILVFGIVFLIKLKRAFRRTKRAYKRSKFGWDDDFSRQSLEMCTREAEKAATPFEFGGYDCSTGNSWNYDNGNSFNDFGNGIF